MKFLVSFRSGDHLQNNDERESLNNSSLEKSTRDDYMWTCQCAICRDTANLHRQAQHTCMSRVYRAFSLCAASSNRQHRISVNHDRTIKAVGNERQFKAATGALSPDTGRPVGADNRRDRCMPGSAAGAARVGRQLRKPLARNLCCKHTEQTRGSGRARHTSRHPADYTDTAHADSSQSSAEQSEAETTCSKITTAARFWWNSVLKMRHRSHAVTAQHHTHCKGHHSTTMISDVVQTRPLCRISVAWHGTSTGPTTSQRFAKARLVQKDKSSAVTALRCGLSSPKLTSESHHTNVLQPNPKDLSFPTWTSELRRVKGQQPNPRYQ